MHPLYTYCIVLHRLNHPGRIRHKDLFNKGLKAYHGTSVPNLMPIVENCGRLYPPGELVHAHMHACTHTHTHTPHTHTGVLVSDSQRVEVPEGHYNESYKPHGHDPDQIFLSPSIVYATHEEVYAKTVR